MKDKAFWRCQHFTEEHRKQDGTKCLDENPSQTSTVKVQPLCGSWPCWPSPAWDPFLLSTVLTVPTCSHTPLTCVCPFTSTSSAKRTFTGFVFSLALFSAVRNDDLGPPWKDNSTQLAARPVVPMHRRSSPQYSHGCNHSQCCFHHTTSHLQKRETLGASHLPAQSRHAAGFQTYLGSHWAQTQLPNNKWTNMQHILCTTNFTTYLYSYCV